MHANDLLIDDRADRKTVETVGEYFPELYIVASLAFIIETVDSVDRRTLVIATQKEEILRKLNLVGKEKANCLQRLFASVHIITKEEVVGVRREAPIFEDSQQIRELSMHIAAYLNGSL